MMARWTRRALLGGLGTLAFLGSPETGIHAAADPRGVLYFFTTPEAAAGPEGARRAVSFVQKQAGRITLRPVLLIHDWGALRTLTPKHPLVRTLKELEAGRKSGSLDLPLYDEEGLLLAQRWEIQAVPAFVLVRGGRAHRTAGSSADLEHLSGCAK
jgi:hypothetical protein